jgi:hypothetical protein
MFIYAERFEGFLLSDHPSAANFLGASIFGQSCLRPLSFGERKLHRSAYKVYNSLESGD